MTATGWLESFFLPSKNADKHCPYKTLGIDENAAVNEVSEKYLRSAAICLENGDKQAFIKISNAYQVLGDENKKGVYDKLRSTFIPNFLDYKDCLQVYKDLKRSHEYEMKEKYAETQKNSFGNMFRHELEPTNSFDDIVNLHRSTNINSLMDDHYGSSFFDLFNPFRAFSVFKEFDSNDNDKFSPKKSVDQNRFPEHIMQKIENQQDINESFVDKNGQQVKIEIKHEKGPTGSLKRTITRTSKPASGPGGMVVSKQVQFVSRPRNKKDINDD